MATATTFDASKLVRGEKYPMRGGHPAEYVRRLLGTEPKLLFIVNIDDFEMAVETDLGGIWAAGGEYDVISDDPWFAPGVEVACITPYVAVFNDGSTSAGFDSRSGALAYAKRERCHGVASLPAMLTVTPVNP